MKEQQLLASLKRRLFEQHPREWEITALTGALTKNVEKNKEDIKKKTRQPEK